MTTFLMITTMFGRHTLAFFSHHLGTYIQEHSYYTTRNFQKRHSQECKESGNSLMALGRVGGGAAQHRETEKNMLRLPTQGFLEGGPSGLRFSWAGQTIRRNNGSAGGFWKGNGTVRHGSDRPYGGRFFIIITTFLTTLSPYLHQALDGENLIYLLFLPFLGPNTSPSTRAPPPLPYFQSRTNSQEMEPYFWPLNFYW